MRFREVAGDMARTTSGVWRGIAEVVDPATARRGSTAASPIPTERHESDADPGEHAVRDSAEQVAEIDLDAGTMLVPIDAWTRVLEQLGNLHDAGQQLADARERAAKAETENTFLREQLSDLKAKGGTRQRRPAAPRAETDAVASMPSAPSALEPRSVRARRQLSSWLSP